MVPEMILIKKFPGTFFKKRNNVMMRLMIEASTTGDDRWPSATKLVEFPIISPLFCKPIKAINIPIPTEMDSFNEFGIAFVRMTDNFVKATIIKRIPDMITTAKASL